MSQNVTTAQNIFDDICSDLIVLIDEYRGALKNIAPILAQDDLGEGNRAVKNKTLSLMQRHPGDEKPFFAANPGFKNLL